MNSKLIPILVAGLFAGGNAAAADDEFTWSGSVGIGARGTNTDGSAVNGARGLTGTTLTPFEGPASEAKANEYRDIKNSAVLGIVDVEGSNNRYFLRFFGENFGRDDQYLNLRGGKSGDFKYQLYQDKMPHNLTWNALTPFSGIGSPTLTNPGGTYPNSPNPAAWNSFDYKLKRNNYGGNVEVSLNSPWFVRADYNEFTMKGVRPGSARLGTGSGNGFVELGIPTDYTTRNLILEGGYAVKKWNVAVNFTNSRFSNGQDQTAFQNFYMRQAMDTVYQAPENELTKWSVNGAVRELPGRSTLAGRFTFSSLKNSFDVPGAGLLPTNSGTAGPGGTPSGVGYLVTAPSSNTFKGKNETTTGSVSLTSNPMKGLDSRIYFNYYNKNNDSTLINYAAGGLGTTACPANASVNGSATATNYCIGAVGGALFAFEKQDLGFDLNYKFNPGNKLSGGYQDLQTTRTGREDAVRTEDRKLWLEYKNTMLEDLSARLKYQNLDRRSDINPAFNPSGTATSTQVPFYYRAYDISNFSQDQWKLVADWSPIPFLDLGVEWAYKTTDYKDLSFGRTDDKRDEYNLTVSYGDPKKFRATGLANWENVKFNQAYRNGTPATGTQVQTTSNFDWGTKNTQSNRLWALMADWPVMEKFTLKGSYTWMKTGGGVDFTSGSPLTPAGSGNFAPGPLVNYVTDNTKKQMWSLKGTYNYSKNWDFTGGYSYEKYTYADDQMRGYQGYYPYYQNLGSTNIAWLSGAFANPSYKINVLYVMGTYKFE